MRKPRVRRRIRTGSNPTFAYYDAIEAILALVSNMRVNFAKIFVILL